MPYTMSNPPTIISSLPVGAKRIWINAFNSTLVTYKGNETIARQVAWTAVKKVYEKNKEGKWIKKQKN